MRRILLLLACIATLAITAASASANSTSAAYGHSTLKTVVSHPTTPPSSGGGGLPFTGLDLTALGVGALFLIAAGVSLRQLAARQG